MSHDTSTSTEEVAIEIASRFVLAGSPRSVEHYGDGLINRTFLVVVEAVGYILQRINRTVFPEPERIMYNLSLLQGHLTRHAKPGLRVPALIPARDGQLFVRDERGEVWRMMELIPNAGNLKRIQNMDQAREVGRILGRFHVLVSDLPPSQLAVTLPGFHVTPAYLERFVGILAAGISDRRGEVAEAIELVTERQAHAGVLEEARRKGQIPERVIHGDPKLDNILFDRETGRAASLIDLDTVQPGLAHYDLGDCLRSCCSVRSGPTDVEGRFDLDLCRAILGAYAYETEGLLDGDEIELFFDAIRLIPFELGLRFLMDHLEGDRYFRVTERGQNLRKARGQLALVEDIEGKESEIRKILAESFRSSRRPL
jgi:Ser/Thr protein kinase RdoA (MazF antagonist)